MSNTDLTKKPEWTQECEG